MTAPTERETCSAPAPLWLRDGENRPFYCNLPTGHEQPSGRHQSRFRGYVLADWSDRPTPTVFPTVRPRCNRCHSAMHTEGEIARGYCRNCFRLDPIATGADDRRAEPRSPAAAARGPLDGESALKWHDRERIEQNDPPQLEPFVPDPFERERARMQHYTGIYLAALAHVERGIITTPAQQSDKAHDAASAALMHFDSVFNDEREPFPPSVSRAARHFLDAFAELTGDLDMDGRPSKDPQLTRWILARDLRDAIRRAGGRV